MGLKVHGDLKDAANVESRCFFIVSNDAAASLLVVHIVVDHLVAGVDLVAVHCFHADVLRHRIGVHLNAARCAVGVAGIGLNDVGGGGVVQHTAVNDGAVYNGAAAEFDYLHIVLPTGYC